MKRRYLLKKRGRIWYYRLAHEATFHSTGCTDRVAAEDWILRERLLSSPTSQMPLREYAADYFIPGRCPHVARLRAEGKSIGDEHCANQRDLLERYMFTDPIAAMPICDLRRRHVLDFRDRLLTHLHGHSANHAMSALKVVIKEAYFREDIDRDPTAGVGRIKPDSPEAGVFTKGELRALFAEIPGPFTDIYDYCAFLVAATAGMRRGEILALVWRQVDFGNGALIVDRAWKNVSTVGLPKWGKVRATILPERTIGGLRTLRSNSMWVKPQDLVFCYADGHRRGDSWWQRRFDQAMERAGIDKRARNLKPHSFRHTLNTMLFDAGYNAAKIRASLGWSSETVQAGYTHAQAFDLSEQRRIVEGLFG